MVRHRMHILVLSVVSLQKFLYFDKQGEDRFCSCSSNNIIEQTLLKGGYNLRNLSMFLIYLSHLQFFEDD